MSASDALPIQARDKMLNFEMLEYRNVMKMIAKKGLGGGWEHVRKLLTVLLIQITVRNIYQEVPYFQRDYVRCSPTYPTALMLWRLAPYANNSELL